MYEFLFLDLDDTILDFHKAEELALSRALRDFGVSPAPVLLARYSAINVRYWQRLERGELTREQVMVGRFETFFQEVGIPADPADCAARYGAYLAIGHYFLPGAEDALHQLHQSYRLYLASNGNAAVQAGRLASAGIRPLFEDIFVSEEMGVDKPSLAYFQACFQRIPDFAPERALMVGDSLTSDIRGGRNAGIATCWVNPLHLPADPDIPADYEIEALAQLPALLEAL